MNPRSTAPPARGRGAFSHVAQPEFDSVMRAQANALPVTEAEPGRALLRGVGQVLVSQIAVAITGLATLPILGRRLGPEQYGQFSLFVMLLGVVTYQDVARQLLIHAQAKGDARSADLDALTRLSTLGIVVAAAAVGGLVLSPIAATALIAIALLHGLSSRAYATLAVAGRVGAATAIRNFAWSAAFVASCALAFVTDGALVYALPFVLALTVVFVLYRRMTPRVVVEDSLSNPDDTWWSRWSGWAHMTRSAGWPQYKRSALDLLGFTLASSVVASADRILLDKTVGGEELGLYCGAADLAARVHIVSAALAATLYPMFATMLREQGFERTLRKFVDIASVVVSLVFVGILLLLAFDRELIALALGPTFAQARPLFALILIGVFVHTFGFLVTPWQRARGDFASQRIAYVGSALSMVAVGIFAVPIFGAVGAIGAYFCGRVAEIVLVWREVRAWPRDRVPRSRLFVAVAMCVAVIVLAVARFAEGT